MELDDLKPALAKLERELQLQRKMTTALVAERAVSRVRDSLAPLFNWQVFQIVAGLVLVVLAGPFWVERMDQTLSLVSGISLHIYGIAMIVNGIRVVMRLREIDYAAPVITLQKRIASLERSYVLSGWILGLPWWLLWIPVGVVIASFLGIDISRVPAEQWLPINIVVGIVGMLLTVAAFHWVQRSGSPDVRSRVQRMVSGASISNAKRLVGDIERFESDAD